MSSISVVTTRAESSHYAMEDMLTFMNSADVGR